jgi:hypothetical protein
MKSKEEGMKTAVLELCTADFRTKGRSWEGRKVKSDEDWRPLGLKPTTYLSSKIVESLVGFVLGIRAVEVHQVLKDEFREDV